MSQIFDFSTVNETSNDTYLLPGMYSVSVTSAKYVQPEGNKPDGNPKTPYLELTFSGESGKLTDKFYVTAKALDRLQTIYVAWMGKKLDKKFDTIEAIGAFFELAFNSEKAKKTFKKIIVGGSQVGDRVYGKIPYSRFIIPEDAVYFKEGPFAKDSADWNFHVKVENNAATSSNDVMISSNDSKNNSFDDDLPF